MILGSMRCLPPFFSFPEPPGFSRFLFSIFLASHSVFSPTSFLLQHLKYQRRETGAAEHYPHPPDTCVLPFHPSHPPPFSKHMSQVYVQVCAAYGSAQVSTSKMICGRAQISSHLLYPKGRCWAGKIMKLECLLSSRTNHSIFGTANH